MYGWTIGEWQKRYRSGELSAPHALAALREQLAATPDPAWILVLDEESVAGQLERLARRVEEAGIGALPLYGVPFAVKDNIDLAGTPTTAACPAFSYPATETAAVVQRLLDAGAILLGKTNLDQFATGLVGTRSPYGTVPNTFDASRICGGSSSGSASVVARGLVPFALGTDTAGSGRVPAGFNNIVGLKPTRGACSTRGVVPACRTLDCVSVFALTVEDAWSVYRLAWGFDAADPFSRALPRIPQSRLPARPRLGIPAKCEWYGDSLSREAWDAALARLGEMAELVEIDFGPLDRVAELLYNGPWITERYAAVRDLLEQAPEALDPVVRAVVAAAREFTALDVFGGTYALAAMKREADGILAGVDALLVPTAPTIHRISDVARDPFGLNSQLGRYTNFVNLLDWSALAVPAGLRRDGLPFGITLIGPAWQDLALADFGQRWQQRCGGRLGATARALPSGGERLLPLADPQMPRVQVAVVGAHLTGMPLNYQLTDREAVLCERTRTSGNYRLYALGSTTPPKPGLVKDDAGAPIEVELWEVPLHRFGDFVADVPAPLGIGSLQLEDGRQVKGFICEPWAIDGSTDITAFGGWRAYCASVTGTVPATQ